MKRRLKPDVSGGSVVSDINITPMVDVLLCLLILQMVIQPGLQKGLDLQLPLSERTEMAPGTVGRDQIVLRVTPGPAYALNEQAVPVAELERTLRDVFRDRPRKVLFVDGAEDIAYEDVISVVDAARGAGLAVVGLVPRADRPQEPVHHAASPDPSLSQF
ncbi:MAG TPA: biopolymer transporter ExbD [Gemmatimonadales bacterium]|nr:biopolymer transporter ExbD [Gemmatimonadales bacterium]